MILYKGAGPGSHWWTTDARLAGGFQMAPGAQTIHALVRHIVAYSWPSPYTSFSASFAAACDYALSGPAGGATATVPGYVYEVDLNAAPGDATFVDPALEVLRGNPALGVAGRVPTHHDGAQDLIVGIADPRSAAVLVTPPRRPTTPLVAAGPAAAGGGPPVVNPELRALIFAIRDAEVLASTNVPASCITNRYLVY